MPRTAPSGYRQYLGRFVRSDDWSARAMSVRCATLRDHLVARHGMDDALLAAWWPGGSENKSKKLHAWYVCHGRYQHLAGKADALRDPSDNAADRRFARAVDRSTTDAPEYVWCSDGERRAVYPKSYTTHEYLSDLNGDLAALADADLRVMEAAADLGLDAEPVGLRADVTCLWLWIVTTPGAGLPFDRTTPRKLLPEPPAWTRTITPADVVALVQAFHAVDRQNIAIMSTVLASGGPRDSRLTFAGFLGAFASAHHLDPLVVTQEWAVRRVLATAACEKVAHDVARAAADLESVRGAMTPAVPVTHA